MGDDETRVREKGAAATQSQSAPAPDELPSIAGFTLRREIGYGGMAKVYLGQDEGFTPPRQVAIKLMDSSLSRDADFRARFEREAATVASFRHDNIVHVYASGDAQGTKYIIMECLPGGTLTEKLEHGPLDRTEALQIGARLADALAYSHACHIIHRDFKPGNVLFTAEGKPVLSDFGVAKSTSAAEARLTRHASVIGAPRYMAPEQERGEEVTDRADVFSFSLTLFEMLAGAMPPTRLRVSPIAAELARQLPDVPSHVIEMIARGLAADPAQRPSAREMERMLTSCGFDNLTATRPAQRPRADGRAWLNRALLSLSVAMLIVGVASVGYYLWGNAKTVTASIGAPPVRASGQVRLGLIRYPDNARIQIDGRDVPGSEVELAARNHELVARAPGYYGIVEALQIAARRSPPIEIRLEPVVRPTGAQFERFLDLDEEISKLDTAAAVPGDSKVDAVMQRIDAIPDRTLQVVLKVRLLQRIGAAVEADTLQQHVAILAGLGDARAAVTAALFAAAAKGRFTSDMVTPELTRASQGGDPFASFLVALALRDVAASAKDFAARTRSYQNYCSLLQTAVGQGWVDLPAQYKSDCRT
jgi:hypothetical protein